MIEEEILALLRLQKTPMIGDILAKKLIAHIGSAADIFKEKKNILQKINGIGKFTIENLFDNSNQRLAELEFEYIKQNKIQYSYFLDNDYPVNLKHCIDGPILFFRDGSIDFSNDKIISIVGTRRMTNYSILSPHSQFAMKKCTFCFSAFSKFLARAVALFWAFPPPIFDKESPLTIA